MTRIKQATRRDFVRATAGVTAFALAGGAPLIARGKAKYTLKIATLAPKGSSWMKSFEAAARELKKTTDGEAVIKLYGGGVMGDEPAMVRKMRTGQLDGAAVTNVGLGDINKQLLMLQLPLLFKRYSDLDRVRNKMAGTFSRLLQSSQLPPIISAKRCVTSR